MKLNPRVCESATMTISAPPVQPTVSTSTPRDCTLDIDLGYFDHLLGEKQLVKCR